MKPLAAFCALICLLLCHPAFCGEIHEAAKAGDLEKVKALLKANPELVNARTRGGMTPLHVALQFGHEKIVEVPPYGFVLGSGGVSHSHRDVVKLLLDSGADANAKTDLGLTPLHFATEHKELAVLLLKRGADVNTKENSGVTPLHCAAIGRRKTQERRRCTQRQQEATRKWWNCYLRLGPMSAPRIITV